ncbi:exopolysaccharide biosynthesis polyprenyl glycosylphosphotransferase [Synoicihabitans lomoniglobus]|uniref:Exopolysaccharide biosynthesis polyprenyl glycosylphosphotransferase n=1 Tax=Synoicihabitans lomoniglobus TaxID=2909285 RepID=A0AAF0CST9_9BACT|nr:exopolysaccharide biosynthesis polyprenyl glycosylphosphotransferase [Opitutaceae bacterium LMO-M01]WED67346.1 exopolysaccharide biosynthesis polyprenyl glycosylphosphotransferase [Opitutaceae bacterium LMO-M01]
MSLPSIRSRRLPILLLLGLDTLVFVAVFNLSGWLRGIVGPERWIIEPLLVPLLFTITTLYLIDGYRTRTEMMSADYTSQHCLACLMAMLATLLVTFVAFPANYPLQGSRSVIAITFLVISGLTLTYRRSLHRWLHLDRGDRSVLFIGNSAACKEFREVCASNGMAEKIVCAVMEEQAPTKPIEHSDSLMRDYASVLTDIRSGKLRTEAIVLKESAFHMPLDLANQLTELYFRGVPTYTLELFYESYWRKIPLYRINHIWLFQEGFEMARSPIFGRMKRLFDVIAATTGLIIASPVLLAAALAIKLQDGSAVLFRQSRVGLHRQSFKIIKLRSMTDKPVLSGDNRYTQNDDPRITRIGGFLRKTRLDEVPQLWNVLKGDMSLIGPRAEWDELVKDYDETIPCYHFRHLVKPGITGWAQINYPYGANIDDTLRKLEYDLYYIRHFSFVMDAAIVLRTIHIMLFGKGK